MKRRTFISLLASTPAGLYLAKRFPDSSLAVQRVQQEAAEAEAGAVRIVKPFGSYPMDADDDLVIMPNRNASVTLPPPHRRGTTIYIQAQDANVTVWGCFNCETIKAHETSAFVSNGERWYALAAH